jgi:signal peptidase II
MSKKAIAILTIFLSLFLDQVSKIWVKLTMYQGQHIDYIGTWAQIRFVENEGMAFGISFGAGLGKFLLTFFRIIAVGFITYYIAQQIKNKKASNGFIFALSLILAGAVGNIIDSIFYGKIFSGSIGQVATLFPKEGGYASWFHGRVVDMLYFPIITDARLPMWIPQIGGSKFEFFPFIFNISDACITIGVFIILIFQKKFFIEEKSASANTVLIDDTTTEQPVA